MKDIPSTKKNLIIVAHPDDEIIWMGGLLLRHREIDWTILVLCRASDADRAPKFRRVCDYCGARGIIEDLSDDGSFGAADMANAAYVAINKYILLSDYDAVFTHGQNGEYGHPGHVGTYRAVKKIWQEAGGKTDVFCFHYRNDPHREHHVIGRRGADIIINLSDEELAEKKKVVAEMYGYPYGGIDVEYCTNPEVFRKLESSCAEATEDRVRN